MCLARSSPIPEIGADGRQTHRWFFGHRCLSANRLTASLELTILASQGCPRDTAAVRSSAPGFRSHQHSEVLEQFGDILAASLTVHLPESDAAGKTQRQAEHLRHSPTKSNPLCRPKPCFSTFQAGFPGLATAATAMSTLLHPSALQALVQLRPVVRTSSTRMTGPSPLSAVSA